MQPISQIIRESKEYIVRYIPLIILFFFKWCLFRKCKGSAWHRAQPENRGNAAYI